MNKRRKETLVQSFMRLAAKEKRRVHLKLCANALDNWDAYASSRRSLCYVETVCGTRQSVDRGLSRDAFESARVGKDIADVRRRYLEPIAAMQDEDLEFPESVEFAYYSLYNLFEKYVRHREVDDWLIVNQVLSSEADDSKRVRLLEQAMAELL